MEKSIDTLIVGAGQAGLATSYFLQQHGREHLVLDKAPRVASAWRAGRWDSFTLITPNWTFLLPGAEYAGDEREGFMPLAEVVERFDRYVESNRLPVQCGVQVTAVEATQTGAGFVVRTTAGDWRATHVVIAAGLFQGPKRMPFADTLTSTVTQIHSSEFRNSAQLPPGAVLVLGSGQSGCQIAEELNDEGRQVYLSLGSAGRAPRRYRGKDTFTWLMECGFMDRTPDMLPTPRAKYAANPQVSGQKGGHTLNLHKFARDGIILLGRVQGGSGTTIQFLPNRNESLARCDAIEKNIVGVIDGYIQRQGIDAPPETLPELRDGYAGEEITELDLEALGITTVIWATGYNFDFSWVRFPVFDGDGFPVQKQGVTEIPGLYFVGLPWMTKYKSGLLAGVGEDAAHVATRIAGGA